MVWVGSLMYCYNIRAGQGIIWITMNLPYLSPLLATIELLVTDLNLESDFLLLGPRGEKTGSDGLAVCVVD